MLHPTKRLSAQPRRPEWVYLCRTGRG
jgi:hypothetical protein